MAAVQPHGSLSSEGNDRMTRATEDAISFHGCKRIIENYILEERDTRYKDLTPHQLWEKGIAATLGVLQSRPSSFAIYRVPSKLRKVNEDAYSPRMVSIGPIHRGREDLLKMEEHKWRYMICLLERTSCPLGSLQQCGKVIGSLAQSVPRFYAEDLRMNLEELMEILLVDGCFMLELFISYSEKAFRPTKGNEIFSVSWMIPTVKHDLALLENQIPFCVLQILFTIIQRSNHQRFPYSLTEYVLLFFDIDLKSNKVKSVLDNGTLNEVLANGTPNNATPRHLLEILHILYYPSSLKIPEIPHAMGFKHCATQILEAGIRIEKGATTDLQDITFSDGVLRLPPLIIDETLESIFRNLIVFEPCSVAGSNYITSYVVLIRSLIRSPKDAKLLQDKGIINNSANSDQDVSTFFHKICGEIVLQDVHLADVCKRVNDYSESWWHRHRIQAYLGVQWRKWVDTLKYEYFPNPWSFISFAAALVLIILTALQTVYTMRS